MFGQPMLVRICAVLLAGFVAAVVAQHALQPGLAPSRHGISQYATGAPGWLMTLGFLSWAGALGALAAACSRSALRPRPAAVAIAVLLGLATVAAVGTAAWRTGAMHGDASGLLELAVWAAAALSFALADGRLRVQTALLLMGALAAAALVPDDAPGVRQRALIGAACAWQAALLAAISRRARSGSSRRASTSSGS